LLDNEYSIQVCYQETYGQGQPSHSLCNRSPGMLEAKFSPDWSLMISTTSRIVARLMIAGPILFSTLAACAQQTEIPRYDLYGGFANFETPYLNLNQSGFHTQEGYNWNRWVTVGFDFSEGTGNNSLTPRVLTPALQQELAAEIGELEEEGEIPAGYQLVVPTHAFSETFALGPQLMIRHYQRVTFFARPSIGTIRQRVTPHPTDPVSTAIVAQLMPAGTKVDYEGFYGFGGGFDWNLTRSLAVRAQNDLVYWKLFDGLLAQGTWTNRFAVGLSYHFGKNILTH
jgi:hypothetical protein